MLYKINQLIKKIMGASGWSRLWKPFGIAFLVIERGNLAKNNLYSTQNDYPETEDEPITDQRTIDGRFNDLKCPMMGTKGSCFGRNIPLENLVPLDKRRIMEPNPRLISNKLLARKEFIPATSINLLAAVWIQFMVHDWFNTHVLDDENSYEIPLEEEDDFIENPMTIEKNVSDSASTDKDILRYTNRNSHWWDGTQIYGNTKEQQLRMRTKKEGKLKITDKGLLPYDDNNKLDLTGIQENWWLGLSLLHTLFAKEHNAICDMLHKKHPSMDDEELFQKARLINTAIIARIHTIEWTPALTANPILVKGMNANWYGVLGKDSKIRSWFSSYVFSGIPGSECDHYGVPLAMTEEFVAVYRLHSLLPDKVSIHSRQTDKKLADYDMEHLINEYSRPVLEKYDTTDLMYSFGTRYPGALTLHNYPEFLRNLPRIDGKIIDLASVDVLRDRERQIPRYNEFRRQIHLEPAKSFIDLTKNQAVADELAAIYKDIEDVDLLVGCLAETPPVGFAFSETAFQIFLLMAPRRLFSDRFFTADYRPEIYTQEGLDWIDNSDMTHVLLRHYPELVPFIDGLDNAFVPWCKASEEEGDKSE